MARLRIKKGSIKMKKNEITNTMEAIANELKIQFELHKNVSLRRVAQAIGLNYQTMLKASKQPVVGQPYNPDELNFDAVAQYITKRDDAVEAFKEINWLEMDSSAQQGRQSQLSKDINDPMFDVGKQVYLRINPTVPYNIIFKTGTHIVLMLEGTEEPVSWSHNTFFFKGPQATPRTVKVEKESEPEA